MLGLCRFARRKCGLSRVKSLSKFWPHVAYLSVDLRENENGLIKSMVMPHEGELVNLAQLNSLGVSKLLNNFGFSPNTKYNFCGKDLANVDSKSDLEEMVDSEVPNLKFKTFTKYLELFRATGVPKSWLLNDCSKLEDKDLLSELLPSKVVDRPTITPVSDHSVEDKRVRDYTKVKVMTVSDTSVYSVSLTSTNQIIAAYDDNTIRIWNADTGECEQVWDDKEYVWYAVCVLNDGRVVNAYGNDIRIYDKNATEVMQTLKGHTRSVYSLFVLDDNTIVSCSSDRTIRLWNSDTGECLKVLEGHEGTVYATCVISENILATCSLDKTIRIWNVITGECVKVLEGHTDWAYCLCKLPDGRLASGRYDKSIRIWNVDSGLCEKTLLGHTDSVRSLGMLPDGRLMSGSHDRTIRIWNVNTGECDQVIETAHNVYKLLVLKDGRIVCDSDEGDKKGTLFIRG